MSTESDNLNIEILLQKFLSDSLSETEAELFLHELNTRGHSDPAFAQTLGDSLWMHSLLGHHYRSEKQQFPEEVFGDEKDNGAAVTDSRNPSLRELDELVRWAASPESIPKPKAVTTVQATDVPARNIPKSRQKVDEPDRLSFLGKFAMCIGLLLVFFMICTELKPALPVKIGNNETHEEAFFAQITLVADPVFHENADIFKVNQKIGEEIIHLESGLMELVLVNNVRIVLEGPCIFNLRTTMQGFCQIGRASVEVPENAIGFEVLTPFMNIRDLGTKFVVEVTKDDSIVQVVTGKVAVTPLTGNWTEVTPNLGLQTKPGNTLVQIPVVKSNYIDKEQITEAAVKYEKRCLIDWQQRRRSMAAEPELLVQLDFLDSQNNRNFGLDLGKGGDSILGCSKVPGRWNGKNAVSFSGPSDAIRVSSPNKRSSFTMFASVRLNDLSHASNVIFSVGNLEKGALHWQINQAGQIQLLIGNDEKESLENFASPSLVVEKRVGIWLNLACAVDTEKEIITHYLDGKQVAVLPWNHSTEFDFSVAELGNWRRSGTSPSKRHFNGEIDEFILLGRVATPEEIRFFTNLIQNKEN